MKNVAFTGHGTGFKPGMDLGPYDPKQLHGKEKDGNKMTEYDMLQIRQLLPDAEIERLFLDATTEKRQGRENGTEKRKVLR